MLCLKTKKIDMILEIWIIYIQRIHLAAFNTLMPQK